MSSTVLDASAVLALLNQESGSDQVVEAIAAGAAINAVNLSEVVAKLTQAGMSEAQIRAALGPLHLEVVPFDVELAYRTALLQPLAKQVGLSLGDRACLALAQRLGLPAMTTDRAWGTLSLGIPVRVVR